MKDPKTLTDIELLDAILYHAEKVQADKIRIKNPISPEYADNAQYWHDKRNPLLIQFCKEYLRRNQENGN